MLAPIARILVKQQGHDERSSQIRHNLVRALRRLRDPRAVPALARALQMEIDEEWRLNETVDALSECAVADQTPQIGQCLSYLLSASRDSKEFIEPAERVLEWMADHRDLRATPFVVPALLSWHDDIREGAREVLAELRDPAAARGIVEAWKNGNEDARRDLVELLEEGYPGVRFDGDNRKVTLIDDDELEKLLQRRTQRMQDAEERKKRLQEPLDVF
jgi:HEAT repeat protein